MWRLNNVSFELQITKVNNGWRYAPKSEWPPAPRTDAEAKWRPDPAEPSLERVEVPIGTAKIDHAIGNNRRRKHCANAHHLADTDD